MSILLAATVTVCFVAIWLIIVVIQALRARPLSGAEGMIGSPAVASTDIDPERGWVSRRGVLWRARSMGPAIPKGSEVKVREVLGLWLIVETGGDGEESPRQDHASLSRPHLAQLVPLATSELR